LFYENNQIASLPPIVQAQI